MLTTIGVGLAVAFNPLTSYFTSTKRTPVKEIVRATKTGPATTILTGLSVGMESTVWALVVIVDLLSSGALLLYGGEANTTYVLYAVAMVGIGMLSHTGNNVAMDSYGPISDNANGIAEMAWHDQNDAETIKARQIMADLDAVGNTTKAITKGVAIASAVIAAVSLFASYITDVAQRPGRDAFCVQAKESSPSSASRIRGSSLASCWAALCPGCSARCPSGQSRAQPARSLKKCAPNSASLASWKAKSSRIMPG